MENILPHLSKAAKAARARLLELIGKQELLPGQRLPPERDLVPMLRSNRSAVRDALARLCAEGIIDTPSPRIRIVAENPSNPSVIIGVIGAAQLPPGGRATPREQAAALQLFGLTCALQDNGLTPLLLSPEGSVASIKRRLRQAGAGALLLRADLFAGTEKGHALKLAHEVDVPVCSIGDMLTQEEIDAMPGIVLATDHARGSEQLVRHLANKGCRRVLRIQPTDIVTKRAFLLDERARGYEAGCEQCRIEAQKPLTVPLMADADNPDEFDAQARICAGFLLEHLTRDELPAGLIVLAGGMFHYVATACRKLGYEPGRDVLITTYGNDWELYGTRRSWEPYAPDAIVATPLRQTGEEAAAALERAQAGEHYNHMRQELIMMEPELSIPERPGELESDYY